MGQHEVRDIRDDLLERLEATTAELVSERTRYDVERRDLEQRFAASLERLHEQEKALHLLLSSENVAQGGEPARPRTPAKELRLPILDFISNAVDHTGSMTKDDIKDAVERAGYVDSGESAGRMVHTTLLNMIRAGKLFQDGEVYTTSPKTLGHLAEPTYRSPLRIKQRMFRPVFQPEENEEGPQAN